MRRIIRICILSCFLLACASGEQDSKKEKVNSAFTEAMKALDSHDYDTYLTYVDFGTEMDSIQYSIIRKALSRQQDMQVKENGGVNNVKVMNVSFVSDTIGYIRYQLTYNDSTRVLSSQKMILVGEDWKIRIRN